MAKYVDGYVLPVPKKSVPVYRAIARKAAKLWLEHGALEFRENAGEDLKAKFGVPFTKLVKTKPSETVIFSWIVFKSRAHRDRVNAKVMSDPRLAAMMDETKCPFDPARMCYGGFEMIVDA